MASDFKALCKKLGYAFHKAAYLEQALTHCSVGQINNERLEFLGDSILSFVIADVLFERFPKHSEGELSRLRAYLVKGETLAEIAMELGLGDSLFLGQGELKSGGFRRTSILADALEAVFAAVYLDGGLEASRTVIVRLYKSRLNDESLSESVKDPKTQLQEYLQGKKYPLPTYELIQVDGEEHRQRFHVRCIVKKLMLNTEGQGNNRRKAEQEAAKLLLEKLKL